MIRPLILLFAFTLCAPAASGAVIPSPLAGDDCLDKSLALKSVTITNTTIDRGSPFNRENTTVTFRVANAATGVSATCNASDVAMTPNGIGSDPYKWYDCVLDAHDDDGDDETTSDPEKEKERGIRLVAKFQYDATLNFLTVSQTWVCKREGVKYVFLFFSLSLISL